MLKLYEYKYLIGKNTPYAKKMKALSNQIFGEVVRETPQSSMRVVKFFAVEPPYKRDFMVKYYPRHPETGHLIKYLRNYGLFRDEHQDFKEDNARLRALRGRVPRPFGSGEKKSRTLIETR